MSRGTATAPKPSRVAQPNPPAWRVSLALFAAVAAATGSLHVLFLDQAWWLVVVVVTALVLGMAAVARHLSARRWLPPLAGAVALVGSLTLFFAPGAAILGVIPSLETLSDFATLFDDAGTSIYEQSVPANADASIVFALAVGVGALALFADVVANTWRRPALAGVPLVVILAVPATTTRDVSDPLTFALTAAAYLVLLVAGQPRRSRGLAFGIGASAILGALVLPLVLPGIGATVRTNLPGMSTGVNPVIGLGDDLRRAGQTDVLSYTTQSGSGHYLRLVTLEDFTGTEWAPTAQEVDRANTVDDFAPAPGLSRDVATVGETTTIQVGNLASQWLPLPYPPTRVSGVSDDWYWEPNGFSVSSPDATSRGQDYVVDSLLVEPTPEQLTAAGTTLTPGFESYLALPEDLPAVISETAASVASASPTNYGKAIALQEFFRGDSFTYSEDAPVDGGYDGTGMEIIATFLDVRSGYCVHFASSMAVMARSLGIPARVVVGFLPGTASTTGGDLSYSVTTHDLHAWPELYFDGVGWVQFEPTPGRGELSDYANVAEPGVPAPPVPETAAPSAAPVPTPTPSSSGGPDRGLDDSGAPVTTPAERGIPWIAGGLILLALLSLVPALVRRWQRMRLASRLATGDATAIDVWTEVLSSATDLRIAVPVTSTPRETAVVLGAAGFGGQGFGDVASGATALDRLLVAVEREGYSRVARERVADPRAMILDLRSVRSRLAAAATPRTRAVALIFPASLWRRIAHPLGAADWVHRDAR